MHALLGSGLLMFGGAAGWAISRSRTFPPVRFVTWWVRVVLLPRLCGRSWLYRATAIYVNNMLILTVLMLVSTVHWAVIVVAAVVGTSMGIAIRALQEDRSWDETDLSPAAPARVRRMTVGLALNLLEPPAIALTIGLALGRVPRALNGTEVWTVFVLVVAPAMLAAACGESLWMGVTPGFDAPARGNSRSDEDRSEAEDERAPDE